MKSEFLKRSLPAFLMSLALVMPLLASCSGGSGSENAGTPDSPAGENASAAETEPAEYIDPKKNLEGRTFTFLDYQTDDYFWKVATYSDIHAAEMTGDTINDAQYDRNTKVENLLNFKLNTHPVGGSKRDANGTELKALILAADSSVDAAWLFGSNSGSLMSGEGFLYPLNEVENLNLDASWWDQNAREDFTLYGTTKLITGDMSLYAQFAASVLYYNKAVAEAIHLPDLYQLVREGKWTLDKEVECAAAALADLNGDGVYDKNDRLGYSGQRSQISEWFIACDCDFTRHTADGGVEFCYNNEKTVNIIEKYVPVFNDRTITLMANDYSGQYSNIFAELFIPMFTNNQILFNCNQLTNIFELRAMESDFGILPPGKYDEDQKDYCTKLDTSWLSVLCVPVTCAQMDIVGCIFDAMGYYSQQLVTPAIIDSAVRSRSLRDEDSAEMLEIILANKKYCFFNLFNFGNAKTTFTNLAVKNNINFVSAYESIESAQQSALETTLAEFRK